MIDEELYRSLGRIEEKLENVAADVADTKEYVRGVSERVRSLENSRAWGIGLGAGAGGAIGWLMSLFGR